MITLIIIIAFILMLALCGIVGLFINYGWALFVIADIAIAVKFLCWLFGSKNKTDK